MFEVRMERDFELVLISQFDKWIVGFVFRFFFFFFWAAPAPIDILTSTLLLPLLLDFA